LAPLIFGISGILSIDESLPNFSDPIRWIFASGFVLAAAAFMGILGIHIRDSKLLAELNFA